METLQLHMAAAQQGRLQKKMEEEMFKAQLQATQPASASAAFNSAWANFPDPNRPGAPGHAVNVPVTEARAPGLAGGALALCGVQDLVASRQEAARRQRRH